MEKEYLSKNFEVGLAQCIVKEIDGLLNTEKVILTYAKMENLKYYISLINDHVFISQILALTIPYFITATFIIINIYILRKI